MPRIIRISVSTSRGPSSASCSISVKPDPANLSGIGHGNGAHVHWDIVTAGWTFVTTGNGIAIANHGTKFTRKGDSNGRRRHTWQRDEIDGKTYQYTIRITDGTTMIAWDPSIVNS
jgi:hypothetical protein